MESEIIYTYTHTQSHTDICRYAAKTAFICFYTDAHILIAVGSVKKKILLL